MNAPALRPLSTGEILDVSFGLYRQRFGPLVKVALVTAAVPMLIEIYVTTAGGQFANLGLSLANLLLKTVLNLLALGATIFIVSESYLGHDLSAADALKRWSRSWADWSF
jgi:DMSO reductase anchor subunit